jgi:hypothetical protein
LQDVGDYDEKKWRERIAMSQTTAASNPASWHAIQQDDSFARGEDVGYPAPPISIKTPDVQNCIQARPLDRVERLLEVELEYGSRSFALVTTAEKVSGVNKIFRNAPPMDKAGLVSIHQSRNVGFKTVHQVFGEQFHWTILKGNRHETIRRTDTFLLWQ